MRMRPLELLIGALVFYVAVKFIYAPNQSGVVWGGGRNAAGVHLGAANDAPSSKRAQK